MLLETFQHNGRTVEIHTDEDPSSPREYDNYATLACWHRHRNLGDEQIEGMNADELHERVGDVIAILPLYVYEHGGITMSTGAFSCPWDSGQVGWGYITKSRAATMGEPNLDRETAERYIREEVSTYDDYLTGQCYGYVIEGKDGDHLDSCWGFIGDLDYVRQEAKSAAEHIDDPAVEREAEALACRATFAGTSE